MNKDDQVTLAQNLNETDVVKNFESVIRLVSALWGKKLEKRQSISY